MALKVIEVQTREEAQRMRKKSLERAIQRLEMLYEIGYPAEGALIMHTASGFTGDNPNFPSCLFTDVAGNKYELAMTRGEFRALAKHINDMLDENPTDGPELE